MEHVELTPLREELNREREASRREAINLQQEVEPTEGEKKNGWTKKTLTKYLSDRMAAQSLSVDVNSLHRQAARRPNSQNHQYRVHRWRR